MRWCCGSGSSTSSANINNNCQENNGNSDCDKILTSTTLISNELNNKTKKNLSKHSKTKYDRDCGTKCKNTNENYCILQQHQNNENVQLIEFENCENAYDNNKMVFHGALKSLLRYRQGDYQHGKVVQYSDEIKLLNKNNSEDNNKVVNQDERINLLQSIKNKNISQLLMSDENKLENDKKQKYKFIADIKKSNLHNSSLPIIKQNNNCYSKQFDKYGPMLIRTNKTVCY